MTAAESFASFLLLPVFLACLWRARWTALAVLPAPLFAFAQWRNLVDISSASHPLRFVVPIAGMSLAMLAAWWYAREMRRWRTRGKTMLRVVSPLAADVLLPLNDGVVAIKLRALIASILVFSSDCADIPALLAWRIPGEWVLVPLQIAVCLVILVVLLAPERWFSRWTLS